MKLNMGCGNKRVDGFTNVDKFKTESVDEVVDLELIPWPWDDNSCDEMRFIHSMEHLGQSTNLYLSIIKEIYRVMKDGSLLIIHVTHPRSDNFLGDPTHCRPVTPQSISLFDRKLNDEWKAGGVSSATTLAHHLSVDIRIEEFQDFLHPYYQEQFTSGKINELDLSIAALTKNNVINETHIHCRIFK
jgi:ubiquinone/menaquinone biosynthesis C-methylase UbiE